MSVVLTFFARGGRRVFRVPHAKREAEDLLGRGADAPARAASHSGRIFPALSLRRPPAGRRVLPEFFGVKIAFSWGATVLAASVISFPLMYRCARGAFEQVDRDLLDAGRTLGMSEWRIFRKILLPNALHGAPLRGDPGICPGAGGVRRHGYDRGKHCRGDADAAAGCLLGRVCRKIWRGPESTSLILVLISFIAVTGMSCATYLFQGFERRETRERAGSEDRKKTEEF